MFESVTHLESMPYVNIRCQFRGDPFVVCCSEAYAPRFRAILALVSESDAVKTLPKEDVFYLIDREENVCFLFEYHGGTLTVTGGAHPERHVGGDCVYIIVNADNAASVIPCDEAARAKRLRLEAAHDASFANGERVRKRPQRCGCFYCLAEFESGEAEFIHEKNGRDTAVCPRCSIDSVLCEEDGFPLDVDFLREMREQFF